MTEQRFQHELLRAQILEKYPPPPTTADYWAGYQRGLRRAYHGENFGTPEEHKLWLSLSSSDDETRRERGYGYEAAFWQHAPESELPNEQRRP